MFAFSVYCFDMTLTTSLVIQQIKPTVVLVPSRVDLTEVLEQNQSLAQGTSMANGQRLEFCDRSLLN